FVSGVEVAVGAFFNGQEFILPACINFEHKRMFNGDIGPSTGEMGTLMFWAGRSRLYSETLEKFKPILAGTRFVGYFDINCIVNSRGVYPLEITPRFGYPTISIQMEGVTSKWGEFLYALGRGDQYPLRTRNGFQIGVVVAVPPYPFSDPTAYRRYSEDAVIIFKKPMMSGIHHGDVKLVNGDWRLAGSSGYALVVTGSGATVEEARRETYNRVKNIIIPNMFYRSDIGERWIRDADLLLTWGYLS
ncbi:MAG TPA: phosphoribosylglycinamide synthetase C domain-containing protein, partial [Candidatus Bathyarchaeia archaeon]|nr:phosphoribosylglycinamide synthetase C domain-containing protein [Candidatus Bathyarchaeia archaeon]